MISETGLVRAMKSAWKEGGYTVTVRGEMIFIRYNVWEVLLPVKYLPRKVLALLVEHIGSIVKDGEAYTCSKKGGAQTVTPLIVFEQMEKLRGHGRVNIADKTSFLWFGFEIWQAYGDLRVCGVDPQYTEIVDEKNPGTAYILDNCVGWEDVALIRVAGVSLPEMVVSTLSSVQWIGGAEK